MNRAIESTQVSPFCCSRAAASSGLVCAGRAVGTRAACTGGAVGTGGFQHRGIRLRRACLRRGIRWHQGCLLQESPLAPGLFAPGVPLTPPAPASVTSASNMSSANGRDYWALPLDGLQQAQPSGRWSSACKTKNVDLLYSAQLYYEHEPARLCRCNGVAKDVRVQGPVAGKYSPGERGTAPLLAPPGDCPVL